MSFYSLLGMTPEARLEKAELAYIDKFTEVQHVEAAERVAELEAKVREAQHDADPYVRLYALVDELNAAVDDLLHTREMRSNSTAISR